MNATNTTTPTTQITPSDLELFYADLDIARTLIEASEHFYYQVRDLLLDSGSPVAQTVIAELNLGDTVLSESKSKIEASMSQLHDWVQNASGQKA